MNNSQAEALITRIRAGDLVTIRDDHGTRVTGRAYFIPKATGPHIVGRIHGRMTQVTTENLIAVRPCTRDAESPESDATPTMRETFKG